MSLEVQPPLLDRSLSNFLQLPDSPSGEQIRGISPLGTSMLGYVHPKFGTHASCRFLPAVTSAP